MLTKISGMFEEIRATLGFTCWLHDHVRGDPLAQRPRLVLGHDHDVGVQLLLGQLRLRLRLSEPDLVDVRGQEREHGLGRG